MKTEWFTAYKLSLNSKKSKYIVLDKVQLGQAMPLKLTVIKFNNRDIEGISSPKFLWLTIGQNFGCNEHTEAV